MRPYAMTCEFIDNRRDGGKTAPMTTQNMTTDNKSIVQKALTELVGTGDVDALAPLLSDDFVHHRPDSTSSTKAEWLAAVRAALVPLAGMQVEIDHVLADGDHVVMHSRRRLPGGGPEIVVVDIWRIDDGLIAEAWEIIEPVAQAAAHLVWWEPADH
ncbi:nuclear transport factor 2 family protein [Nonomuraea sp. NPDC050383]|uniref:nuclear transport factor 2 family protein n=1 Tax=Nonomuraea sp. NPDC050383 TaxID=3364362 RepID=UPI0037962D4D